MIESKRLDKETLLEKLSILRGVLSGEVDPKDILATAPTEIQEQAKEKTEGGNRRMIALAMLDWIGHEVYEAIQAEAKDREGRVFGFAAGRPKKVA